MADNQPDKNQSDLSLLYALLAIDSPSGDEGVLADWLMAYLPTVVPDVSLERLADSVIARRGLQPSVAVFAHLDTTGWTLGYDNALIPIGGPDAAPGDLIRPLAQPAAGWKIALQDDEWALNSDAVPGDILPGSRWVYAAEPHREGDRLIAPYLDNRAGLWAAIQTLRRCETIAVAFTVGEEHGGQGAMICARRLYEADRITRALIADITWDTDHIHCGQGVAISLRDRSLPRRRFLEHILALADTSGIPFQREIESSGGSDGAGINRSGIPMDWVFIGAPEAGPHTSAESLDLRDLYGMADMLTFLVHQLLVD